MHSGLNSGTAIIILYNYDLDFMFEGCVAIFTLRYLWAPLTTYQRVAFADRSSVCGKLNLNV